MNTCTGGLVFKAKAGSLLFSVPPVICLCAHIDVELVATENRNVFL